MEDYYKILEKSPLFEGIAIKDFDTLYGCLGGSTRSFAKGETIFMAGDPARRLGLVLEGEVQVVRDDPMGVRTILTSCTPSQLFAESFSFSSTVTLPISVIATKPSRIMFFNSINIIQSCPVACGFHATLTRNMVKILAEKNIVLTQKNEILSSRTTRQKLMTYFSILSSHNDSNEIILPFNRQSLADYLSVDRSAMSTELGRLRDEGYINVEGNKIQLLKVYL